jgi:hypothetical protein
MQETVSNIKERATVYAQVTTARVLPGQERRHPDKEEVVGASAGATGTTALARRRTTPDSPPLSALGHLAKHAVQAA